MVKKPVNGNPSVHDKSNDCKMDTDSKVHNLNSSVESNAKANDSLNSTSELSFTNNELFYLHDKMTVN